MSLPKTKHLTSDLLTDDLDLSSDPYLDYAYITHTAGQWKGNSGGAVVNEEGELIGMSYRALEVTRGNVDDEGLLQSSRHEFSKEHIFYHMEYWWPIIEAAMNH